MKLMIDEQVLEDPILKTFIKTQTLPFEYDIEDEDTIIADFLHGKHPSLSHISTRFIDKSIPIELSDDFGVPKSIDMLSVRKKHEVSQFLRFIGSLARNLDDLEFIIDVGSGSSYISRLLARNYNVICVERDPIKLKQSRKIESLHHDLNHRKLFYVNSLTEDFVKFIDAHKSKNGTVPKGLIIGLDSCGDLSSDIIETYTKNDIKGLYLVGCCFISCCYNKSSRFISTVLKDVKFPFELLGTQDLAELRNHEVVKAFQVDKNELKFHEWCFIKGFITNLAENLIHYDRWIYLKENLLEPNVDVIFEFEKSSRNICVSSTRI